MDVKILIERGKELGKNITLRKKNDIFIIGESTPGGTTTAQAVLNLLGYKSISSSSFELNPTKLKNEVINQKFEKLGISFGDYKDNPLQAIEICGDPMMAAAVGIISGIIETSKSSKIILSGGTQMISVYCILKNLGIDIKNVSICTTKYVYEDKSCNIKELEKCLNLKLRIVNPEFELSNVAGIKRYTKGTIKEGAGAGGMI